MVPGSLRPQYAVAYRFAWLYHFRRKAISPIDKRWADRVQELAVKLGIRQVVSIAESGIAKVPMVIGHLKPLILIPMGLITAMPPEEIEAILVHELAHIRRRDYLVNLLQSLMKLYSSLTRLCCGYPH